MAIEQEVQRGWHDAIIELFEIDISGLTGDANDKFYFTNGVMPDNTKMRWKGIVYEPLPIEASGFEKSTKGQLPRPEITVANVLGTLASVVNTLDDLVGAKVTRRRTLLKYLDGSTEPDTSQEFPDDVFYIERKVAETNMTITWQLASKIDIEGLQLPKRIITQDYCVWKYRGAECGYAGPPIADRFDRTISNTTGDSTAAAAYAAALAAFETARYSLQQAEANRNYLYGAKEAACSATSFPIADSFFNLEQPYNFVIQNGSSTLVAVAGGTTVQIGVPGSQYAAGRTAATSRGPGGDGNGTGPTYGVKRFVASSGTSTLIGDYYSPTEGTFAIFDASNRPILFYQGQRVDTRANQFVAGYEIGAGRSDGFAPMRFIDRFDLNASQCGNATTAYNNAVSTYNSALQAYNQAKNNLDAC